MLVHKLRVSVAPEENTEIVEPSYDSLQLDAVNKEDGERRLVFANVIEKGVL